MPTAPAPYCSPVVDDRGDVLEAQRACSSPCRRERDVDPAHVAVELPRERRGGAGGSHAVIVAAGVALDRVAPAEAEVAGDRERTSAGGARGSVSASQTSAAGAG